MFSDIAVFSDLDGTLFNSRSAVSPENRRAIRRFTEQGGLFGISTGRSPENAAPFLEGVAVNGWSVVLNGAAACHFEKKELRTWQQLHKPHMDILLDRLRTEFPEINIQLCTPDHMYFLTDMAYADREFLDLHREMHPARAADIRQEPWLKILLCGEKPRLEQLRHFAAGAGLLETMDWVYSSPTYLEFLPRGISKGSALNRLRDLPCMQGRTILAMGDFYNDLSLLQCADIGLAVANAVPELKAAADEIICSNDDHAFVYLTEELIPRLRREGRLAPSVPASTF